MTASDQHDPYEVLQVSKNAEQEVIEAAYKRLAQKYHPDVSKNPDATEKMQLINWAYEILGDKKKRQEYDQNSSPSNNPPPNKTQNRQQSPEVEIKSDVLFKQTSLGFDKSCHCWRCGYDWTSRKKNTPPAVCPRCKSDNWNKFRRFECQKCRHTFTTGELNIAAYTLFPTCPSCKSKEWNRQEEQRKKQTAQHIQKIDQYHQQVISTRLLPGMIFARTFWLMILLPCSISGLFSLTDTSAPLMESLHILGAGIGGSFLVIFVTGVFKKKSINERKLNKLIKKGKITHHEADIIRGRML